MITRNFSIRGGKKTGSPITTFGDDVTFDEASSVFADTFSLTIHAPLHSEDEERFIIIGVSCRNRMLTVVHTERGENLRIISARKATKKEILYYENHAE